jgi:hypothetical protein
VTVEAAAPVVQGNEQVINFTIVDTTTYRVEYYLPYNRQGNSRDFTITWPGDYAVGSLQFILQEPVGAKNVVTDPVLPNVGPHQDKFIYHSGTFPGQPANTPFVLQVSYEKADDILSSSTIPVESTTSLDQTVQGQTSLSTALPWVLAGLGLTLVAGGIVWYWISGRNSGTPLKARKRHAVANIDEDENEQAYCSQCGKRAQPGDRFCRACGARLKRGEA